MDTAPAGVFCALMCTSCTCVVFSKIRKPAMLPCVFVNDWAAVLARSHTAAAADLKSYMQHDALFHTSVGGACGCECRCVSCLVAWGNRAGVRCIGVICVRRRLSVPHAAAGNSLVGQSHDKVTCMFSCSCSWWWRETQSVCCVVCWCCCHQRSAYPHRRPPLWHPCNVSESTAEALLPDQTYVKHGSPNLCKS